MKLGRIAFPWDSITQNVLMWVPWWLSGKESACQCRRHEFDPWVRKILRRRKWKHCSIHTRKIPWIEESSELQPMGLQKH